MFIPAWILFLATVGNMVTGLIILKLKFELKEQKKKRTEQIDKLAKEIAQGLVQKMEALAKVTEKGAGKT